MKPDTFEELQRRANEAQARFRETQLAEACAAVGIGVATLQGRERGRDTAKRRAVVVWVLCDRLGWRQKAAAAAVGTTTRHVKRMLRNERVTSPPKGT